MYLYNLLYILCSKYSQGDYVYEHKQSPEATLHHPPQGPTHLYDVGTLYESVLERPQAALPDSQGLLPGQLADVAALGVV